MPTEELLTRWTVRAAVALYVLSLTLRIGARGRRSWQWWARIAWTIGCLTFLLHVACAFQFFHHWSHPAALEATARQTSEFIGLNWGGGLYANYVFAIVWIIDTVWWWRGLERYSARPRRVEWFVQAFMAFMVFNATVVFGTGPIRWFGLACCVWLAAIWRFAASGR